MTLDPQRRARPPGPAPVTKNPFSLLAYMRRMRDGAAQTVGARFETYGDIYYAPFLGRDVYVLRHPDHIREVLIRQASKLGKPTSGLTASQLSRLLGEGLLNANGDSWRRRRRLIQPAFSSKRLQAYAETIGAHTEDALARWRPGQRVDLSREMMELTLRIVSKTLFDHDVHGETDRFAAAIHTFRQAFGGIDAMLPDWVPTRGKRRTLAAMEEVDALVYGLIDARRASAGGGGDDLLTALATGGDGDDRLTRRELRDELLTLFIAGHETTSHALTWTLHLLSQHRAIEARVRDEVRALDAAGPGWDDLPALDLTRRVLEESMRLYPPAYAVPRTATEDVEVGGYVIPAGADVVIWIHHVHRDGRWFEDPERFDPDRFLPERKKALPQCAYLPFGAGQRACIGKQFAMMEAQLILARVLRAWRFDPDPAHVVRPRLAVTMSPRGGLPVFLREADIS